MSWRRLEDMSSRRLQDVFKTSSRLLARCFQDQQMFAGLILNSGIVNSLKPGVLWITNKDLCFKLRNSININLKRLIFPAFLTKLSFSYHLLTQKGKNEFLKFSLFVENLVTFVLMLCYKIGLFLSWKYVFILR